MNELEKEHDELTTFLISWAKKYDYFLDVDVQDEEQEITSIKINLKEKIVYFD